MNATSGFHGYDAWRTRVPHWEYSDECGCGNDPCTCEPRDDEWLEPEEEEE